MKYAEKSIESLRTRLNEFIRFLEKLPVESSQDISYRHLREFIGKCGKASVHVRKARIENKDRHSDFSIL
jgi:integrase/recombinase XerC